MVNIGSHKTQAVCEYSVCDCRTLSVGIVIVCLRVLLHDHSVVVRVNGVNTAQVATVTETPQLVSLNPGSSPKP